MDHDPRRRRFLQGLMAGAGAAILPATSAGQAQAAPAPFHGHHQAGITSPQQTAGLFGALDSRAPDRARLAAVFRILTTRARALAGTDNLTVTVGVGATLFDDRYGLAERRPRALTPMRAFANDRLRPGTCHGDLSLQLCADHQDTILDAWRDLTHHLGDLARPRWTIDGFLNPPRPTGVQRNLMGFKDGIENPAPADPAAMDRFVWVTDDHREPGWAVGGTYQVIRIIRMHIERWDRLTTAEQEHGFGRRKDSGAPLSGHGETDTPDYTHDPRGHVTPLDSHARLANPRTPATDHQRILRRGYNYDRGLDSDGGYDLGVAFCSYQRDVRLQYEAIQTRLDGERLATLLTPTGGGYFYALPGLRDSTDWYAAELLTSP